MAPTLARVDQPLSGCSPGVAFVCWNGILGGAQTFTVETAGALRRRNFDAQVVFVCESAPLDRRAEALGVPWATVGLGRGRDVLLHPRRLARTIGEHGRHGSVLVSSGYLAAAARAGGYRAPLIAVEHGTFLQVGRLPAARRALRRLDRRSGLWACSVEVAVSDFLFGELRQRAHAASLVCIPNGVDLERFAPRERGGDSDEPIIGCAARLVPGKGVDDLLRAAALLRVTGARWRIAGDGPDRRRLENLAGQLGVQELVEFLGRVDDMPAFWRSCSVAVVPSHEGIESFGLVAIEAMATGVPVVATRNGGLVEVVGEDGESGTLVQPGSPPELAAAISGLLRDEDLRNAQGRRGRRRVERLYSLDACADSYAKLIASVTSGTRGSRVTRERPLRALVLTNMYPTTERPDLGSVVREQVRELAALGVRSEIVAIRGQQSKAAYVNVARSLPLLVRQRDFDLVHAHYGLSGAVALAQRRLPVITTFHGSDTGYVPWQGAVSWIVARVTTPVFVSRRGAERLGLRGTGPNIIPCGVDIGRFQPMSRARARAALGWDHDAPIALLPGARENAVKRADLFESAAAEARSSVPDLRTESLENFTREEVQLVLNAVDVTVMTSDSEGSPVTIKESLACETPVVSVDVGDVPDVVSGLPGCFVVCRDPTSIGAAIVRSLEAGKSSALRERAERYSGRRIAEALLDVYRSVLR